MTFYQRYAAIAEKRGLDPGSQKAASLIGSSKSTVSKWNTKNITPLGETVAAIADALSVSTDYLLGRTDDPTDFTKKKDPETEKGKNPEQKTITFPGIRQSFIALYNRLDETDKLKIEGVIQGMLMQDKYNEPLLNAAHTRTDITVTDDMISHDETIMDDDHF